MLLLLAVSPLFGQMCKVELSSPTKSLGVQGKQTVFVEAAFSETYQKKKTVIEPVQRQPLNVSFVLDVSGSMEGQPLEGAKKAMLTILNNLYPGDVVSITVSAIRREPCCRSLKSAALTPTRFKRESTASFPRAEPVCSPASKREEPPCWQTPERTTKTA